MVHAQTPTLATRLAGTHLALGGGGLGGLIVHLIIWHFLWRLVWYVWRIPTFGPFLVLLIVAAIVGMSIWRRHRGPRRSRSGRGSGGTGTGTGTGPRDW
ncbi:MAG TPA: hypothetical protein VME44_16770 [Streptosporangiaceae bacterium]|nr:hypothetical protein [Streptosporangiaceae bacterium]